VRDRVYAGPGKRDECRAGGDPRPVSFRRYRHRTMTPVAQETASASDGTARPCRASGSLLCRCVLPSGGAPATQASRPVDSLGPMQGALSARLRLTTDLPAPDPASPPVTRTRQPERPELSARRSVPCPRRPRRGPHRRTCVQNPVADHGGRRNLHGAGSGVACDDGPRNASCIQGTIVEDGGLDAGAVA
jgi:hypothetical protein